MIELVNIGNGNITKTSILNNQKIIIVDNQNKIISIINNYGEYIHTSGKIIIEEDEHNLHDVNYTFEKKMNVINL